MDVLSDVLETVRLRGLLTGAFTMAPPWGFRAEAAPHAVFFTLTRGSGWLEVDGVTRASRRLEAGDVVVLPRGDGHILRDDPRTRPIEASMFRAGQQALPHAASGNEARMVGGCFPRLGAPPHPVLESLPPLLHLRKDEGQTSPWLDPIVHILAHEAETRGQGAATVLNRLADVLFVQVLRTHLLYLPEDERGFLRGLTHPGVAAAMHAIHTAPERDWPVAALARKARMSRSAFAAVFVELVGEPPAQYLTRWRIARAADLLSDGNTNVKTAAALVGYASESAFRRVFRKWVGVAPKQFQRTSTQPRAAARWL